MFAAIVAGRDLSDALIRILVLALVLVVLYVVVGLFIEGKVLKVIGLLLGCLLLILSLHWLGLI
jgi:hypothetical protein